eukprot:scaffold418_cov386-Prasinococcus_capsulatus_cf.AAC.19
MKLAPAVRRLELGHGRLRRQRRANSAEVPIAHPPVGDLRKLALGRQPLRLRVRGASPLSSGDRRSGGQPAPRRREGIHSEGRLHPLPQGRGRGGGSLPTSQGGPGPGCACTPAGCCRGPPGCRRPGAAPPRTAPPVARAGLPGPTCSSRGAGRGGGGQTPHRLGQASGAAARAPHLAADSPLRGAPVKDTSFARAAPTSRGSFCERPQEGAMPRRQCQSMNRASLLTRTMSAAKAISKPALTQAPWTHAMMGAGHCSIHLATTASGRAPPSRAGALPNTWETALRSTPEQKEGPSPIKMTQPTDASAERAWKAAPSWLSTAPTRSLSHEGTALGGVAGLGTVDRDGHEAWQLGVGAHQDPLRTRGARHPCCGRVVSRPVRMSGVPVGGATGAHPCAPHVAACPCRAPVLVLPVACAVVAAPAPGQATPTH